MIFYIKTDTKYNCGTINMYSLYEFDNVCGKIRLSRNCKMYLKVYRNLRRNAITKMSMWFETSFWLRIRSNKYLAYQRKTKFWNNRDLFLNIVFFFNSLHLTQQCSNFFNMSKKDVFCTSAK